MFDLFTLFGIKFRAEWTVLFLALIMSHTGVSGILAILVVIISHELGHAMMVRARGGYVESIVLQGFGGMTLYQGINVPKDKTLVAFAGPLVNLLVAGILWNLTPLLENNFVSYLMFYSFLLGVFNLLPILPLDGGHILEGILSMKMNAHQARVSSLKVTRIGSIVLAVVALQLNSVFLLIFSVFFFFLAHKELEQLNQYSPGAGMWKNFQQKREEKKEQKEHESDLAVRSRVDQLLAKISKEGMSSLTREERDFLSNASDRFK